MDNQISWATKYRVIMKVFSDEYIKSPCEIVDIYDCQKTVLVKAIIKFSETNVIEKNVGDIVGDNDFIESFDKKTIRALTYIATMERIKPDYSVSVQHLNDEVDDYILEIQSKNKDQIIKKHLNELFKDKSLLARFSPVEATRIGYLAGIKNTAQEFKIKSKGR